MTIEAMPFAITTSYTKFISEHDVRSKGAIKMYLGIDWVGSTSYIDFEIRTSTQENLDLETPLDYAPESNPNVDETNPEIRHWKRQTHRITKTDWPTGRVPATFELGPVDYIEVYVLGDVAGSNFESVQLAEGKGF